MTKRIDIIGQNGNEGLHYQVEDIARIIAGKDANNALMGKYQGKKRWELFIPTAIEVIEYFNSSKSA